MTAETTSVDTKAQMTMLKAEKAKLKAEKKQRKADKKALKLKKRKLDQVVAPVSSPDTKKVTPDTEKIASGVVATFRKNNVIEVTGNNSEKFSPYLSFKVVPLSKEILKCTNDFPSPTPIQSECLPILLANRDCIGIAKTGSGKTLAFGLPGISKAVEQKRSGKKGPFMLVVAPTRELAIQSEQAMSDACKNSGLTSTCIYGGAPVWSQLASWRKGIDVIVATPGRLLGLMTDHEELSLANVVYVTLDEADRMLDMGFKLDIVRIMNAVGVDRQTVMFSATWPVEIRSLAGEFLSDPVKVVVGNADPSANKDVTQVVEVIDGKRKNGRCLSLLRDYTNKFQKGNQVYRIIVFALYKKEAARVENFLQGKGFKVASIHGDKNQRDRESALHSFVEGKVQILVATDVAARGLDIPEVELVLNYTFPLTIEDYIHRIGRTGRAGCKGLSHTFFTDDDKARAGELVNCLKEANMEVPEDMMKFNLAIKKKTHFLYGSHYKTEDSDKPMPKATHVKF